MTNEESIHFVYGGNIPRTLQGHQCGSRRQLLRTLPSRDHSCLRHWSISSLSQRAYIQSATVHSTQWDLLSMWHFRNFLMETWCVTAMRGTDFNIPITCHVPVHKFFSFIYSFYILIGGSLLYNIVGVFLLLFVCFAIYWHVGTASNYRDFASVWSGTISEMFAFHKSPPFWKWHPSTPCVDFKLNEQQFYELGSHRMMALFAHVHLLCRLFCDALILGAWEREYVSKKIFRRTAVNLFS